MDMRKSLQALRKMIHAAAPGVEECISYNLPAFRLLPFQPHRALEAALEGRNQIVLIKRLFKRRQ